MGSGTSRKANDKPTINTPIRRGSGVGGSGGTEDINKTCPPGFEFLIKPQKSFPEKTKITVVGTKMFILNIEIGQIPERFLKIISECSGKDILYTGYILNRESKTYAHFSQYS